MTRLAASDDLRRASALVTLWRTLAVKRRDLLRSGLPSGAAMLSAIGQPARAAGPAAPPLLAGPWLNSAAPLDAGALRGKVSLVNFWTYTCIYALRSMTYIKRWHEEYGPAGLQVVGIHTPEFGFEHLRPNVELALREYGIRFPVGQDNDYRTWRAWSNQAWPSFYILDREAWIVMLREGEGHAMEMERTIRGLLGRSPEVPRRDPPDDMDVSRIASPEMYFGAIHPTPQESGQSPRRGLATYAFSSGGPRLNRYELDGTWLRDGEPLVLRSDEGRLRLRYSAAKVHLVMGAPNGATVGVRSGTEDWRSIRVGWPALYTVVDGARYGEQVIELEAMSPGLALYSATFG
ncbi:redoxin domain-containing protein [Falsiroseomonas sp. HW251]|uniref:redoxin domain-containing protein n=1 Tax=Falsiroseomonas sp. HW251 TaxID=3390998 RepID=UPI003D31BB6D